MPFDAQAPAEVTARDRMIRLRDFLATLDPKRFAMADWEDSCGTSACIAGWHGILIGDRYIDTLKNPSPHAYQAWKDRIGTSLGLTEDSAYDLFMGGVGTRRTTPKDAVKVLDHYLTTGEIDWSVAK